MRDDKIDLVAMAISPIEKAIFLKEIEITLAGLMELVERRQIVSMAIAMHPRSHRRRREHQAA